MYLKQYETEKYLVKIYLTTRSDLISFDGCFEMNIIELLPKIFKCRDGGVFTKLKLKNPESILMKIECTGKVTFMVLKKLLPTVFDFKAIRKLNEQVFIKENKNTIINMTKEIIGKARVEELLERKDE